MKKGFTLVELLATITILGIIALLLVPTVTNVLSSFRGDASENQKKSIVSAAKLWASDHRVDLPSTDGETVCVKVSELKQGYLEDDLKDPNTKQSISNNAGVQIKRVGKSFEYTYQDTCSGVTVSPKPTESSKPTNSPTPSEKPVSIQLALKNINVTSSSITLQATATVTNDTLKGYQFSSNGSTWTSVQTSGAKVFSGLAKNTKYELRVRAISKTNKQVEKSITVYTNSIGTPTYRVSDTSDHKKNVTIQYPSSKESTWVYEYSLDSGRSWNVVSGVSYSIKFEQSGTVIARVRDTGNSNNTVTASVLTVTVEVPQLQVICSMELASNFSSNDRCVTFNSWHTDWAYVYKDGTREFLTNATVEFFYPGVSTPVTYYNQNSSMTLPNFPSPYNSTCAGDGKQYKVRITAPNGKTGTVVYSWKLGDDGRYTLSSDLREY